jgi:hypothetical protein
VRTVVDFRLSPTLFLQPTVTYLARLVALVPRLVDHRRSTLTLPRGHPRDEAILEASMTRVNGSVSMYKQHHYLRRFFKKHIDILNLRRWLLCRYHLKISMLGANNTDLRVGLFALLMLRCGYISAVAARCKPRLTGAPKSAVRKRSSASFASKASHFLHDRMNKDFS